MANQTWSMACSEVSKQWLMVALVACFVVQSCLVYFDPSPAPALSSAAQEGRRIWHSSNCQSCHQLYGFGGFLGPDLTNAAERLTPARLVHLLTVGSREMPAFGFSGDEIASIGAFLEGMNGTGQGQARYPGEDPTEQLLLAIEQRITSSNDLAARDGYDVFMGNGCQGCHVRAGTTTSGIPDLLDVCDRLDRSEVFEVLENGRLPNMPVPPLSPEERQSMFRFLSWLTGQRAVLRERIEGPERREGVRIRALPWWEFG